MTASCLIVSNTAAQFAEEVERRASIPIEPCASTIEAREKYAGQPILFGDPDMLAEILPDLPDVDWVQSTWAGITPLTAVGRRDYVLTGVKNVFGPQMTEYVLGYLLAHELRVVERDRQQAAGNWFDSPSGLLHGKRLGIMGTGSIGAHIARIARVFGLAVRGLSLSGTQSPDFDDVQPVGELHSFLETVDYLVSVLPATHSTANLLDGAALARLPTHAFFINVGRGNVVDDDALIDALRTGRLAGAVLDVFDEEPVPAASPLWRTPNLTITAHIAAISHPALIVPIFIENYRRYCNNEPLKFVIDLDKGY